MLTVIMPVALNNWFVHVFPFKLEWLSYSVVRISSCIIISYCATTVLYSSSISCRLPRLHYKRVWMHLESSCHSIHSVS